MTNRVRSLATRVTASLTTVQPLSSSAASTGNDEMMIEKPSLKRIESFTSHIHHFAITSPIAHHSSDENVSSPESPKLHDIVDAAQEENIAFKNEAATNQYFTYDVKHAQLRITVLGPGGVTIPEVDRLRHLIPDGTITVMCLTWNVASRSQNHLSNIGKLITNERPTDRADLICLCFQELPSINAYYHQETVKSLTEAVADTHLIFCWVRKWSQLVIVFIRESLVAYTSTPEWQFISCSPIVKPVRTKGAIAVFFRIFQTSVIFVACHMTHGPVLNRICDYSKICDSLRFSAQSGALPFSGVKEADCVFWFGDLNFRLRSRERVDALDSQSKKHENMTDSFFDQLLIDDELTLERCKGNVFKGFNEAYINFPPTHKFILGTNNYVSDRIPSYTDRILYYAKESSRIRPGKYDCLWEENASDHKPVYGFFTMRVLEQRY
ncbi:endonuclease/Exonuclease/phosphatase [Loa loa]|uniref:Endonuclease/Exonuclease/phosphatase n=1 Tax=Loa loa TaxID=7209 RepID=A0A1I7V575_LOALO|nr:endonuclease/Exonuclease/phosphatase [Loa loa]EFO21209.2 endonuclease/Exonuclease/phosphatase [Loa loa]